MNCRDVESHLPELVYSGLPDDVVRPVLAHLQGCPACRRNEAALRQVRGLLDLVPVHKASLDVGAIYRAEAGRQRQHARRWRWMAGLTASAAAAVIAVAFLSRLEIRVE